MIRLPASFAVSLGLHGVMAGLLFSFLPGPLPVSSDMGQRFSVTLSRVVPALSSDTAVKLAVAQTPKQTQPIQKQSPLPVPKPKESVAKKVLVQPGAVKRLIVPTASEVKVLRPEPLPVLKPTAALTEPAVVMSGSLVPPPVQAVAQAQPQQLGSEYLLAHLAQILALLKSNLFYPKLARKRHIEGEVVAVFRVASDGTVHDVSVKKHARGILDRAAVETIHALSGQLPHPKNPLRVEVPIRFVLK